MAGFLSSIGLEVEPAVLSQDCFLRGLDISHGKLRIDESRLAYPGDILHEAGHLAVFSSQARRKLHGSVGDDPGNEMAAIAWSYAAAIFLEIDLTIVFHADGYRGSSPTIIDNFSKRYYVGVPILEWLEMTADTKRAAILEVAPYPHMLKWLND